MDRRRVALPFALVLTTVMARHAAADPPPDLPALPAPRPAAPAPAPAARPPAPVLPYGYPPPGFAPPSRAEIPPGYPAPMPYGAYPMAPYPYPAPLPAAPRIELPPSPARERFSTPMMASGIVLTGAGLASIIAGSVLTAQSVGRIDVYCDTPSMPCAMKDDAARKTAGVTIMTAGGLMSAAGVVLWIVGSKTVLARKKDEPSSPRAASLDFRAGVASASVSLRF